MAHNERAVNIDLVLREARMSPGLPRDHAVVRAQSGGRTQHSALCGVCYKFQSFSDVEVAGNSSRHNLEEPRRPRGTGVTHGCEPGWQLTWERQQHAIKHHV